MPEDASAAFPNEARQLEPRHAARLVAAVEEAERQVSQAAQREVVQAENAQARSAMRDDGPVLTAMQAAMQQAQADLAAQQGEGDAPAAEAPVAEAPAAAAPAAETPAAEAPADAPVVEAAAPEAAAEPEATDAAEAPAAEAPAADEEKDA